MYTKIKNILNNKEADLELKNKLFNYVYKSIVLNVIPTNLIPITKYIDIFTTNMSTTIYNTVGDVNHSYKDFYNYLNNTADYNIYYTNNIDYRFITYSRFVQNTKPRLVIENNESRYSTVIKTTWDSYRNLFMGYNEYYENYTLESISELRNMQTIIETIKSKLNQRTFLWINKGIVLNCKSKTLIVKREVLEENETKILAILLNLCEEGTYTQESLTETLQKTKEQILQELKEEYLRDIDLDKINSDIFHKAIIKKLTKAQEQRISDLEIQKERIEDNFENIMSELLIEKLKLLDITTKSTSIFDNVNNIIQRYIDNNILYRGNVSVNNNNEIEIDLCFKITPVTYIDLDILSSAINARPFNSLASKEWMRQVAKGEATLALAPQRLLIKINPADNVFRRVIIAKQLYYKNNMSYVGSLNGHAYWNGINSQGCLGNFSIPISEACKTLNLEKLIALTVQYATSIAPADTAGFRSINNPLIIDNEYKTILYDAYNELTGLELDKFIYEGDTYEYPRDTNITY